MRPLLALLALSISSCGARTAVDVGLDASIPGRDAAAIDAPVRDAASPLDAPSRPDVFVPPGACAIGETFEVVRTSGRVDYPALARNGERAMLSFTRIGDGAPEIVVVPITPLGVALVEPRSIARGTGGTLVGHTLDAREIGFTLSFRNDSGMLAGARFDADVRAPLVGPLGATTTWPRPMLVITPRIAVNGWEEPGTPAAAGLISDLATRESRRVSFPARRPFGAAIADDAVRVVTVAGPTAFLETRDPSGAARDASMRTASATFPIELAGARVVDGAPDAVVLFGTVLRALEQSYVELALGSAERVWAREGDVLADEASSAYDPATAWLGVSIGAVRDEELSRDRTPHVLFYGLARDGGVTEEVVAGPVFVGGDPVAPRTALLATGTRDVTFLVVWTWNEGDVGHVDGAHVLCP